jgi:predicted transcriptional regulator
MYLEGMSLRAVGRVLGVSPQSVSNWVDAHANQLPPAPIPDDLDIAELDEMFVFIGNKKTTTTS